MTTIDVLQNPNIEILELNGEKKCVAETSEKEIKFDVSKLKDSTFKKMIQYKDSITSAPIEYILLGTITSLSGAIGKNAYFEIADYIRIYLNCYGVIIGKSTISRKTTAIDLTKKELSIISEREYKKYTEENDKENTSPRKYILIPQDSTVESLADILSNSERGYLVHSEFGSLLAQLNRKYAGDSKQFLTSIYDVPITYEITRMSRESKLLTRPCLSILGASTIDWVKEYSKESDLRTGFFARFLFAIRNTNDKPYIPLLELGKLSKHSEYYLDTQKIYEQLVRVVDPIELGIKSDAKKTFNDYDKESYEELSVMYGEEISFKARLLIYCLKFAGIIAITDNRTEITLNDVCDAIHITEYFKRNVEKLLQSEMTVNQYERKEKKVFDILTKRGGEMKHSALLKASKFHIKEFAYIIENLVQKDKIEMLIEQHPYNKKEAKTYKILNE